MTRMCQGWTTPRKASAAMAKARTIMEVWVMMISVRRDIRSAMTPA